jgi:hypothetical protein
MLQKNLKENLKNVFVQSNQIDGDFNGLSVCLPISSWSSYLFLNKTGEGIVLQEYSLDCRGNALFH